MNNNETIIYRGRPSWLNYYLLYLIGISIFVFSYKSGDIYGGILTLIFVIGLSALFRFRYLFTVTEDRIIMRVGLIAKNTNEMQLNHIRAINVRQRIIERILGIGTLITISAAEGEAAVIFKGINDPQGIKEKIRSI
jgi:uncharacterized membrane protein YdbT with pleckstrin-like domain